MRSASSSVCAWNGKDLMNSGITIRLAIIEDSLLSLAYALYTLQAAKPALESQGVRFALTIMPKSLSQTRHYVETMILRQQDFLIYNQQHLNNDTATLFGIEKVLPYRLWLRNGQEHDSNDYRTLQEALQAVFAQLRVRTPTL